MKSETDFYKSVKTIAKTLSNRTAKKKNVEKNKSNYKNVISKKKSKIFSIKHKTLKINNKRKYLFKTKVIIKTLMKKALSFKKSLQN